MTYRFPFDADCLVAAIAHSFKTNRARKILLPTTQLTGSLLALYLVFTGITRLEPYSAVAGLILLPVIWLATPLGYLVAKSRHKKSPYASENLTITLSSTGFSCVSENQNIALGWAVFTAAHRFPDGFLLKQGKHPFNWLPDAALEPTSNIADAETLIAANVAPLHDHR